MFLEKFKHIDTYVWLDSEDNSCLSPFFDTEEKAIEWYKKISTMIFEEFGLSNHTPNK